LKFSELNINDKIIKAIQRKEFTETSLIQEKVIPAALSGKDLVGKSQTGTGKTAAFAIPIIEKTVLGQGVSTLVVVPTRELALQVKEEIASIAFFTGIKSVAVFGGQSINTQLGLLKRKPEIVVGTPGRLLDLISRKVLNLSRIRFLVLDEADKMFDMGFRDDVAKIISFTPKEKQSMVFSATMPSDILELIDLNLRKNKIVFDLSSDNKPVQEVEQFYVMVDKSQKVTALERVLLFDDSKTLVFCRTKRTVDWLERQLSRKRIPVLAIHGDKSQSSRNKIIEEFKRSKNAILVATDVVSRGIHVEDIGNVVNFDFPQETETYLHRIGRTARQGRKGKAISFCVNLMELDSLESVGASNNTIIQQLQ